jgi:hypothetical protein
MSRQAKIQRAGEASKSNAQRAAFAAETEAYNKSTSRVSVHVSIVSVHIL